MSRTPFAAEFRRLLRQSCTPSAASALPRLARRDFLSLSAATGAALAGCSRNPTSPAPKAPTAPATGTKPPDVVVVGAGLAGVHCAYRLKQAGLNVAVYEASERTGGRTYSSAPGSFESGQVAELGGELVDSSHSIMQWFAYEFDLQLDSLPESLPSNVPFGYQYYLGGSLVPQEQVVDAFAPIAQAIAKTNLKLLEQDDAARVALDQSTSLVDFLKAHGADETLMLAIRYAFTGEFGLELEQLSVFNLLDMFPCTSKDTCQAYRRSSGASTEFLPFGASDELMRFHSGNEGPARALTQRLGEAVHLGHPLVRLARSGGMYTLDFAVKGGSTVSVEAPYVVLALPFSTLRNVELGRSISPGALKIIRGVSYGSNSKLLGQFKDRAVFSQVGGQAVCDGTWVTDVKTSSGRYVHNLWDTSRGQQKPHGLWTNFVGGDAGFQIADGSAEQQWLELLPNMEPLLPGVTAGYIPGKAQRMVWPTHEWTRGSYMAVAQGQIALADHIPTSDNQGTLQFCGEHTSENFQGFMEGAAESGARAANDVLRATGRLPSRELSAIEQLRTRNAALRLAGYGRGRARLGRRA